MADQIVKNSWALLTMHKAVSSFLGEILKMIFASRGYCVLDLAASAFSAGMDEKHYIESHTDLLRQAGFFFGPFRTDTAGVVAQVSQVRPIVHVRDPRDCLVSLYFSLAYSHPVPGPGPIRERFLAEREQFFAMSVDDFALEGLRRGYRALGIMREIVEQRPDGLLSRYEDLVTDFMPWVDGSSLDWS
jgi:hypothetical protein